MAEPTRREVVHEFDEAAGRVRAVERECYGAVVLGEQPVADGSGDRGAALLADAWLRDGPVDR